MQQKKGTFNVDIRKILLSFASLALLLTLAGGYVYFSFTRTAVLKHEHETIRQYVKIQKEHISSYLEFSQKNAELLAGLDGIRKVFEENDSASLANANSNLDYFQKTLKVSVCYLMDHLGNTLASSNRNTSTSFVGKNYGFRPYFTEAIKGNPSVYPALGVTSGERGIYYSYPVYVDNSAAPVGVVVVKAAVSLMAEVTPENKGDLFLVTDPNGVVFIASNNDWLYKSLWEIPESVLAEIQQGRQFGSSPLTWTGLTRQEELKATDRHGLDYRIHQEDFTVLPGWKIIYLHNIQVLLKRLGIPLSRIMALTLVIWLLVGGVIFFLYRIGSQDLRRRIEAENTLQKSEEQYRNLYKNTPVMLHSIDRNGVLVSVSNTWLKKLGYHEEEVLGRKTSDFLTEQSIQKYKEVLPEFFKKGYCQDLHYQFVTKDGEVLDILLSAIAEKDEEGNIIRSLTVLTDVTDKMRLETELRHAQKMEAMGTMAGGIAHNFNNILGSVLGYTDMAKDDIPQNSVPYNYLEKALASATRAKDLVRQILAFSHQEDWQKETFHPDKLLHETLSRMKNSTPENIKVDVELPSAAAVINFDSFQFKKVFTNLYKNALDAMQDGGGVLGVTLERIELKNNDMLGGLNIKPGHFVKVTVSDTGHGMTADIMARVFDPFFTTKKIGEGTGIGLSVAHGIVRKSGGLIRVESEVGKGSKFHVILPVAESIPGEESTAGSFEHHRDQ